MSKKCTNVWCKSRETSFPGFFLFPGERTLVAAGHVEMCANKLRSRGRSSTKFCPLDNEILSGVGTKFWFKIALEFLSCVQTALLSDSYDNIISKAKQVICTWKKMCSPSCKQDTENLFLSARAKSAFCKFAYSARAVHEKVKITQKSGLHETHADGSLKIVMVFSALVNLSAGARYTRSRLLDILSK